MMAVALTARVSLLLSTHLHRCYLVPKLSSLLPIELLVELRISYLCPLYIEERFGPAHYS